MSLPIEWVDRIFTKLALNYASDFATRFKGLDMNAVKSDWAHELTPFVNRPESIKYALQNLPDRVPSAQQFRNLCFQFRTPEPMLQIDNTIKPDPVRVAQAIAKLGDPLPQVDHKAWARKIVAEANAGIKKNMETLRMAKRALGLGA